MALRNLCALCTKSFEENVEINVIPGMAIEDEIAKIESIKQYNDLINDKVMLKNYLFGNIAELELLANAGILELPNAEILARISGKNGIDKISSFSRDDFDAAEHYTSNDYLFYSIMVVNRARRLLDYPISNGWKKVVEKINSQSSFSELAATLTSLPLTDMAVILGLSNAVCDESSLKELIEVLKNPHIMGLVNYMERFVEVPLANVTNLSDEQAGKVSGALCKFYLTKAKKFENINASNAMRTVISLFLDTQCNVKHLLNFIKNVDETFFEQYSTLLNYYNVSLGNKYSVLVNNCPSYFDQLFKFALLNRKFAFLDMAQENVELLNSANKNSLLTMVRLYERILNLNEIDVKSYEKLLKLSSTTLKKCDVRDDNGDCVRLTPKEVIALAECENLVNVNLFYAKLTAKVDTKLLIIRQLANMIYDFGKVNMDNLAKRLVVKNAKQRINEFAYTVDLELLLNILSLDERYDAIIEEAANEIELSFIWRNRESINLDVTLKDNLDDFIENDKDCKEMFDIMKLSQDFIDKNKATIKMFCLKGNATIFCTYYKRTDIGNAQKEAMLRIAKAEMANLMETYKFHNLSKEIEYDLSDTEIDFWKKNATLKRDGFDVYETYSFNDTMLIGEKPGRTCMNYKVGQYAECLLANFDSNKKILFVKKDNVIVGRAIIRLTKCTTRGKLSSNDILKFVDVERETLVEQRGNDISEQLVVFLERCYSGHISEKEVVAMRKLLVELTAAKASEMGAIFLASYDYGVCGLPKKECAVFISHTKNEYQYMDSFDGKLSRSNEGGYKNSTFYTI